MTERRSIYSLTLSELEASMERWGQAGYRARQVWDGLYQQLWSDPDEFSPLPVPLRERLAEQFDFSQLTVRLRLHSADSETQKILFELPGGEQIETVLMRYARRRTLCISTQSGCALGCVFCATGQMGLRANLSAGQIIEQVMFFARDLARQDERLTNIVLMGMGEPFQNYAASLAAVERLSDPDGFRLGARRFTISTVGLVPKIRRFTAEKRQVNLAVSLHAVDDQLRSQLLPINRTYPLDELLAACWEYVRESRRRITFEWALIRDVNDLPEQARLLADRIQGMLCHVNVIPLNPTRRYPGQPSPAARARAFCAELEQRRIPCSIRIRRGIDIEAGCGQLAAEPRPAAEGHP